MIWYILIVIVNLVPFVFSLGLVEKSSLFEDHESTRPVFESGLKKAKRFGRPKLAFWISIGSIFGTIILTTGLHCNSEKKDADNTAALQNQAERHAGEIKDQADRHASDLKSQGKQHAGELQGALITQSSVIHQDMDKYYAEGRVAAQKDIEQLNDSIAKLIDITEPDLNICLVRPFHLVEDNERSMLYNLNICNQIAPIVVTKMLVYVIVIDSTGTIWHDEQIYAVQGDFKMAVNGAYAVDIRIPKYTTYSDIFIVVTAKYRNLKGSFKDEIKITADYILSSGYLQGPTKEQQRFIDSHFRHKGWPKE